MLDTQVQIYSCDTGNFYSKREERLHIKNHKLRVERNQLINGAEIKLSGKCKRKIIGLKDIEKSLKQFGFTDCDIKTISDDDCDYTNIISKYSQIDNEEELLELCHKYKSYKDLIEHKLVLIKQSKEELLDVLQKKSEYNIQQCGNHHKRILTDNRVSKKEIISVFESILTRTIGIQPNTLSDEIIVIQVYYFDILRDIINNGFWYNGSRYLFLTASAGQIRTKKVVFIKQNTWLRIEDTIMCGLNIEKINSKGGINSNKYLAYTALANSATDEWKGFDIDKTIVVDDFETNVYGEYDFVDEKDFSITRKKDYVPITHTDGCGLILPNAFGKHQTNQMIRMPWVKGLLGVFDFKKFIKEYDTATPIIKDIYGVEHNILDEDIQIIFTKSQFKLWKYYDNWNDYKDRFKKYHCQVGFTNPEEERIKNSTINYQMLQSLTDITDDEINAIADSSVTNLKEMCTSVDKVKTVLGITPYMKPEQLTCLQQAIQLYPELLNDSFIRTKLKDIKDSLIKKYKAGKLKVNGKYTFLLPDLYAVCEHWFMGIDNPHGLLDDGEVFCWLYKHCDELDCLRSPHLFMEHAIRNNAANDCIKKDSIREWFSTNAIYTSSHDLISKILQFDVDGDKSLVVSDKTIINVAKRNIQKYDIVPLYYNMAKAAAVIINRSVIYNNLTVAFTGGNIGQFSNNISKIWNSNVFVDGSDEDKVHAINCIKRLCCMNNFVIDVAKTLYKPDYPSSVKEDIKEFTKLKLPYFFVYAKDKTSEQVEIANQSFVNKLDNIIPNPRISHKYINNAGKKRKLDKPDYTLLMTDIFCYVDKETNPVVRKYSELIRLHCNELKNISFDNVPKGNWSNATLRKHLKMQQVISSIKQSLSETGYTDVEIADILVAYLYGNDNNNKGLLWSCYGEILLNNLKQWVKRKTKDVQCSVCGEWFEVDIKDRTHKCSKCKNK